jgi:Sulfotransferase family
MERLHITGCPRSGTTLLMEQMSTCFESDGHCDHEKSIFEPVELSGGLYLSKQPNDIKHLRHIFYRDPRLHIIYLVRDPRSVITSKHGKASGQYFCNYRVWQECERAAENYDGHPRFLRLRYEDLVAHPDGAQERIRAHFTFLTQRHAFSDFHTFSRPSTASERAMGGVRKVDQASLSKWQQHLPRLAHQLELYPALGDELVRLGYEPDRQWLAILDGVEPLEYPCRYPDRKQILREWEKSLRVYLKSRRYLRRLRRSASALQG